jgi:RNA polymerase sigma-70 factor (ECF subfamily)
MSDFESLIEAHSAAVFGYLWRLLRDEADAEDCLQETFLRAFRAYPRLRAGAHANPAAWLYRIATNTARTHQRRRARADSRTAALDPALAAAGDGSSPARLAEQRLALAALARAVDALPHQQRAALILRKYQALSYGEIAETLECSEAAARANVYQAVKRLRRELGESDEGRPHSASLRGQADERPSKTEHAGRITHHEGRKREVEQ